MKAITLYQPYASLIAVGVKTIETRCWFTPYRGPLAIHAAKTVPASWQLEGEALCARFKEQLGGKVLGEKKSLFGGNVLPVACIVAVAELYDCLPTDDTFDDDGYLFDAAADVEERRVRAPDNDLLTGNFSEGRYGWMLANIRPLTNPVPVRGQRGLWDVDHVTQSLIQKELP